MPTKQIKPTYNPKDYETKVYELWKTEKIGSPEIQAQRQGLGELSIKDDSNRCILMPPPNLTGNLHAGHAFQHYFSDTLTRIWRQKGYKSLWYPGVDHAGIQLEGVIDKLIKKGEFDEEILEMDLIIDNQKVDPRTIFETKNREDWPGLLKKHSRGFWLELAWNKVKTWRGNQSELARVLGDTPDYDRELFTLDIKSAEMVEYAFKKYWEDGLLYKSEYLINWSVGLQTAVSDVAGEIEYGTRVDPFVTFEYAPVKYEFLDKSLEKSDLSGFLDRYLLPVINWPRLRLSTVRPETKFTDLAVAMHPCKFGDYFNLGIFDTSKDGFESSKAEQFFQAVLDYRIRIIYDLPPLESEVLQLVFSDKVDADFGTGIVKLTPGHSLFDYKLYNELVERGVMMPGMVQTCIGRDGKLKSEYCGKYSGMTVEQGRLAVMKTLAQTGYIPVKDYDSNGNKRDKQDKTDILVDTNIRLAEEKFDPTVLSYSEGVKKLHELIGDDLEIDWNYEHNVTLCERSKTVIEPLISEEFFIDYHKEFVHKPISSPKSRTKSITASRTTLKEIGDKALDQTKFYPESVKERLTSFLDNIENWTISRDLVWGFQIPLWYNLETNPGKIFYGPEEFDVKNKIRIGHDKPLDAGNWVQETKILDTWFSSCLWPLSTLNYVEYANNRPVFLYIHGGEYFETREEVKEYLKNKEVSLNKSSFSGWKDSLESKLAENGCEMICPQMPLAKDAKYDEWKIWFEKYLSLVGDKNLNLIGYSLGAYFLLKYLSQEDIQVDNLYIVAGGYQLGDGERGFSIDLEKANSIQSKAKRVYIFHSSDDFVVNVDEARRLHEVIEGSVYKEFTDRQHFFQTKLPELEDDIQEYITAYEEAFVTDFTSYYPTNTMVTGVDIIYTWIIRMALLGVYFTGYTPYQDLVINPTVLDEKGRKMSKSLGNGLDVTAQIDRFSSDSTRLALLSGMIPGRNFRMGGRLADKLTEKYRNYGNKLWNVGRFLYEE